MEREADRQIKRQPGQIEERRPARSGQIAANGIEIAHRLNASPPFGASSGRRTYANFGY
jgi:hypothetical protein